ncbi:MAG: hypothetical protein OEV31_09690 [Gammaproteobacteria bacterium]|nr:hypothetical protein [Gammaproteobacteria bacterium]
METREQLDFVRALGCQLVQGYFFSPAVPADAFRQLVLKNTAPEANNRTGTP